MLQNASGSILTKTAANRLALIQEIFALFEPLVDFSKIQEKVKSG